MELADLNLTVRDATAFRQKTGRELTVALMDLQTKVCPTHRRQADACGTCLPPMRYCMDHSFDVEVCDRCTGPRMRAEEWATLDWLLTRHADPDAQYDDGANILEVQQRVGEWFAAAQNPAPAAEPAEIPTEGR